MKAILNKLWGNNKRSTSVKAKLQKVNLGLKQNYDDKILEFIDYNEQVNEIFDKLQSLKNDFQNIDKPWLDAYDAQHDLGEEIIHQLNGLGLSIDEIFDKQMEMTNLLHGGNYTTQGLNFLRE